MLWKCRSRNQILLISSTLHGLWHFEGTTPPGAGAGEGAGAGAGAGAGPPPKKKKNPKRHDLQQQTSTSCTQMQDVSATGD